MRRLVSVLLLCSLVLVPLFASAAEVCWDTQYVDTIEVWADCDPSGRPKCTIHAMDWRAQSQYAFIATSAAAPIHPAVTPAMYRFQPMFVDNESLQFGGNPDCVIRMALNVFTLNGDATIDCTGGTAPFHVDITLTQVLCGGSLSSLRDGVLSKSAAGDPQNNTADR